MAKKQEYLHQSVIIRKLGGWVVRGQLNKAKPLKLAASR